MEYSHSCLKCKTVYKDDDPDAYYCVSCLEGTKKIAKEVDKKLAGRVNHNVKSELQIFTEMQQKTGKRFVNIKDLGITL